MKPTGKLATNATLLDRPNECQTQPLASASFRNVIHLPFFALAIIENPGSTNMLKHSVVICVFSIALQSMCRSQSIDPAALQAASIKMRAAIEAGQVAGAAHLVWHRGEVVHFDVAGLRDIEDNLPFRRDSIVRIYSMSKPITSVAAMTLFEQGKFDLDDAVSKFIPAFRDAKTFAKTGDAFETVPLDRPITVRDVFRHTTGYAYGGGGKPGLGEIYREQGMNYHPPIAMLPPKMTIADAAAALVHIPTHHQPGSRFTYGFSTDLLGRLIEVWSGETLDKYLREAVLGPLQMNDTGFSVPPEKRDRFASVHTMKEDKLEIVDKAKTSLFNDGFEFLSGGGGLVSTIDDYSKFCQMLVGGGELNGTRILMQSSLDLMFTDQLNGAGGGFQFGLGFAINQVDIGTGDAKHQSKEVYWAGYASTDFRVVPDEKLFQIFLRQQVPSRHKLARETFTIVYQGVQPTTLPKASREQVSESSAYWPGWLGVNRDGWVKDFQPPEKWPSELKKRWEVRVGTGYATPVVVGDAIYQHAREGEEEVVWCLDANTGQARWRQSYEVPFKMGGGGESHGKGPKSNAHYADGRLFTFSITGVLSAWDAKTGQLLWRRDKATEFKTTRPYWGATTSPIVDGKRVIVHYGNDDRGVLVAHDVATGEEVWSQGNDGASYSSPLLVEIDGVKQIVEWNHRALVGVDSETGEKLWDQPFEHEGTNQNMPTPSLVDGCILVGGENRGFYSFQPKLDGESWTVEERWFQDKIALDMSSPVVNQGLLFGFSHYDRGRLFCLNTEDGEVLWEGPARSGDNVTFLAFAGHVLALMNRGELKVIQASADALEEIKSYKVSESETWAAPVLLNDGVLVKDETKLTMWGFDND